MSFFPASSFADRAARYSRAASRTAAPLSSQNTCPMIGPGLCRARRLTLRLSSCGPPSCWPLRDCKARTPSTRWEPWSYNAFSRHKAPSSLLRGCRSSPGPWQRGPDICWQPVVRGSSLCEKRGLVCIPSKGMGLCRYGIFGQDLIQPTLCLKYRPSVVSEKSLCMFRGVS
jgi:hypothetical protein